MEQTPLVIHIRTSIPGGVFALAGTCAVDGLFWILNCGRGLSRRARQYGSIRRYLEEMRFKDFLEGSRGLACLLLSSIVIASEVVAAASDSDSRVSRTAHFAGLIVGILLGVAFKAAVSRSNNYIKGIA